MKHIEYEEGRGASSLEWYRVAVGVTELVNSWAGSGGIVAIVSPLAGRGAPACYFSSTGEMELNSTIAFGPRATPDSVGDISHPVVQYEYPRATGLIAHESFHARYSTWDHADALKVLTKEEFSVFEMLEESRIEYHGTNDFPATRAFVRSAVMDINVSDIEEESESVSSALAVFALVQGRVLAGVLDPSDVEDPVSKVGSFLGEELVIHLTEIVRRFHRSLDLLERYELAKEWARAEQEARKDKGEQESPDFTEQLRQAMRNALENVALKAGIELADQEQDLKDEQARKQVEESLKQRKKNINLAQEIFGPASAVTTGSTSSTIVDTRPPTSEERASAVIVARELEKAKYHDRVEIETSNYLPPGRLRTRTAVQAKALKSVGVRTELQPWRRTTRKQAVDPNLTVAMMVDISGSMRPAMGPMATTAWVMSEAVRRIHGKVAMVYYGDSVFPTLKPGQHLDQVRVYSAADSTEEFDRAFRALDGALSLLDSSGARLLVVSSDGHYRGPEVDRCRHWLTECYKSGVAVLWLSYGSMTGPLHATRGVPASHLSIVNARDLSSTDIAVEIGRSAARVLTNAGRQ
jgi:hypothetical protein